MFDTIGASASWPAEMPRPARPPFPGIYPHLNGTDERITQLIGRTSNILERLRGAHPEAPSAAKSGSGSIVQLAEQIEDKLSALAGNIDAIDSFI